jgi:hypothetical protein
MDGFMYMQMLSKLEDMELRARRNSGPARDIRREQPSPQPALAPVNPPGEAVSLPESKSA